MDNKLVIVKAAPDDLVVIQQMARQTCLETFAQSNTEEDMRLYLDVAFSADQLQRELQNKNSEWYMALFDNEPAGYLKVNMKEAQTELQAENGIEIQRIYVLEQYKGQNIGKTLLEKAMTIALEKKVDFIWLGVWEHNQKAIAFYKKMNFEKFGEHCFLLGTDEQTDWLMKHRIDKAFQE